MYVPQNEHINKLTKSKKKSSGSKSTDSATSSDDGWVSMDRFSPLGYTSETPRPAPKNKEDELLELNRRLKDLELTALSQHPNEVVQLADCDESGEQINGWAGSNCHGYTFSGSIGKNLGGTEFLDKYKSMGSAPKIAVFVQDGEIAHSGMWDGSILTHLVIGVGILRTPLSPTDTIGYTERFNLPEDLPALDASVAAQIEYSILNTSMRTEMGNALGEGKFIQSELDFFAGRKGVSYENDAQKIYDAMQDKIDALLDDGPETYLTRKDEEPGRTLLSIYHRISPQPGSG